MKVRLRVEESVARIIARLQELVRDIPVRERIGGEAVSMAQKLGAQSMPNAFAKSGDEGDD